MTEPARRLVIATAEAVEARRRLALTSEEVRTRLDPARVISDVRDRAAGVRHGVWGLVAIGVAGTLLLSRRRIAGAFRRVTR